jgi:hypothetical protein
MNSPSSVDTRDAARCREIIHGLPVTNIAGVHEFLRDLLKAMLGAPPAVPADYLSVLETAREPLAFLQETIANRYAAKPLPANTDETAALERVIALWRLMARNYARVAQLAGGDPEFAPRRALVCQRCIHYAGQTVIEYYRARRAVAPGAWLDLHGYYDTAEDWGLAGVAVAEPLLDGQVTCASTYAAVLLVDLANPYSRSPKELTWILRWAWTQAPETAVNRPDEEAGGRGYGLDLMLDRGLLPVEHLAGAPSARLFDTARLGSRMQALLAGLKAGQRPADLGLGEDCTAAQAARLLRQLYRPWCLAAMPRRFERTKASGTLAVFHDPEAIYFHVTGAEFVQPRHTRNYSHAEVAMLMTFRDQVDPIQPLNLRAAQLGYAADLWQIADRSLNGFRVTRQAAGPRIEHGQLLAVRPPEREGFLLARIGWLFEDDRGGLQAGVHVLPAPATGVALRPTGVTISATDKYVPGYFLPGVPVLKEGLSVVLPLGWYTPGRIIEIFTDRPVNARLEELLARGPNFERCAFTLADPPAAAGTNSAAAI